MSGKKIDFSHYKKLCVIADYAATGAGYCCLQLGSNNTDADQSGGAGVYGNFGSPNLTLGIDKKGTKLKYEKEFDNLNDLYLIIDFAKGWNKGVSSTETVNIYQIWLEK